MTPYKEHLIPNYAQVKVQPLKAYLFLVLVNRNFTEVGYCAQALGYIDFRLGWAFWVLLIWVG